MLLWPCVDLRETRSPVIASVKCFASQRALWDFDEGRRAVSIAQGHPWANIYMHEVQRWILSVHWGCSFSHYSSTMLKQTINSTSMKRFSYLGYGSFGWFGSWRFLLICLLMWKCDCVCVWAQVCCSSSRWLAVLCASHHHRRCDIRYGSD